jgi:DNA-binding NarL/FixJ family response regulator
MTVPLKTCVLLADDHPIVLRGLVLLLDQQPDFEVVAETHDGAQAVARAMSEQIDLAILDVSMPRKTGLQAAREITQRKPDVRVLILSMHENEEYFLKHWPPEHPATCSRPPSTETSSKRAAPRCAESRSCTPARSGP